MTPFSRAIWHTTDHSRKAEFSLKIYFGIATVFNFCDEDISKQNFLIVTILIILTKQHLLDNINGFVDPSNNNYCALMSCSSNFHILHIKMCIFSIDGSLGNEPWCQCLIVCGLKVCL